MNILHTIILSIVEGVTEFLPISSTAHLLLTERLLGIVTPESFTIGIQLGAIAAAALVSLRSLLHMRVWKLMIVGSIPTLVLGFLLYPYVSQLHTVLIIVPIALIVGGILMVLFPLPRAVDTDRGIDIPTVSLFQAFMIGCAQVISFIPGVSRSASTIYSAHVLGVPTRDAVRYSFTLALPVMGAATAYSLLQEFQSTGFVGYPWMQLVIGIIVSGIVAYWVMRWLLRIIQNYSWKWFGYYRIIIGIIALVVLLKN